MPRLVDRIYDQIPARLRGRFKIKIISDPFHLRVEVIVKTADGSEYSTGPINDVDWYEREGVLPDWFVAHLCTLPAGKFSLYTDLWDSMVEEEL